LIAGTSGFCSFSLQAIKVPVVIAHKKSEINSDLSFMFFKDLQGSKIFFFLIG